jgi:hypothetical protein
MEKRVIAISWCGIFILCLAVCFQLLGVPGTLLNFADSEDDFQASVMTGYSITTAAACFMPRLTIRFAFSENPSVNAFLWPSVPFHPPRFL